ncbi:tetratricopeptide repeat-containing sulfotransferase family protein [Elongatibacter sediminis]|uniref:Sulfotransferase n=1 Tax=Elongatibacter sediminis TaxID=3119006 RepID=A0AAW9R9H0_9GAMM
MSATDIQAQLQRASACLQAADGEGCRAICDHLLTSRPDLIPARHLRGLAAIRTGDPQRAVEDLSVVFRAQPGNGHAAFWLGRLLRQADRLDEAVAPLEQAARHPEFEVDARYELARVLSRSRRGQEAESQYRRVLERRPDHADAAANLAFLLERRNRLEESADWADRALGLDSGNFMANLTRAVLDRRAGNHGQARDRLESLAESCADPMNRSVVLNQLGQCLDGMEAWNEAFGCFEQANRLLRETHPLGQPVDHGSYGLGRLRELHEWLTTERVDHWSPNPHARASDPVFLVGFPRSGTTLLDQILSAHPDIEVSEENELFDTVRARWVENGPLTRIGTMNPDQLDSARRLYLEALRERRRHPERAVIVDKLPLNLAYLFLIHRLFPDSPVLFAVRDPRDACLSCFFQSFDLQGAMPYFLDLRDTATYYDTVMRLAWLSRERISNPVHEIRYETVVRDLEGSAREMLSFLGLEFSSEVLAYRRQARDRTIDTPSYQQVVQPLYTRSIGRWRHYRQHLTPVLPSLTPWAERLTYPCD